jgi:hypothetical protein
MRDIRVNASDGGCGMGTVEYSFDNGTWTSGRTFAFNIPASELLDVVFVRVTDLLGNSLVSRHEVFVDGVVPMISVTYEGIHEARGDTMYLNSRASVRMLVFDAGSGAVISWYTVDGGDETSPFEGTINITEPGEHVVRIYCRDAAGNLAEHAESVYVEDSNLEDSLYSFGIVGLVANLGGGYMMWAACLVVAIAAWAVLSRWRRRSR